MLSYIKELYYFNYYFINGTGFNIDEEILAIFLTKPKTLQGSVTLTFVMRKPLAFKWEASMALIIAQEFLDVLTFDKNININYECEYTSSFPHKSDVLCCLFAWAGQYEEYISINFMRIAEIKASVLSMLQATLIQLLVNRVLTTTRNIRCLYNVEKGSIEFTFFYFGEDANSQTLLLQEIIRDLIEVIGLQINHQQIISIQFVGSWVGYSNVLRKGEMPLFIKYDDLI